MRINESMNEWLGENKWMATKQFATETINIFATWLDFKIDSVERSQMYARLFLLVFPVCPNGQNKTGQIAGSW